MTYEKSLELDVIMLRAKQSGRVGNYTKMRDEEDERVNVLCDFICSQYGYMERKKFHYQLTGLGYVAMEDSNDRPFFEAWECEQKQKEARVVKNVRNWSWQLFIALVGSGVVVALLLKAC